jgi:SEL1 protein
LKKDYRLAYRYLKAAAKSDGSGASKIIQATTISGGQLKPKGMAAGLLGHLYWRGEGVTQNNGTAYKWFLKGAEEVSFCQQLGSPDC